MSRLSNSKTFCIYPFTHLNVKSNGQLTLCNRCAPLSPVEGHSSFKDFWRSDKVASIRTQLLSSGRPQECVACWDLEDSGATSYRQESLKPGSLHSKWLNSSQESFQKGDYFIKELELRFGNLCNLQCKICSPKFSSKWERELQSNSAFRDWVKGDRENGDIYDLKKMLSSEDMSRVNQKVLDSLPELAPHLEYVMYSGGEPLLQRDHYASLESLLSHADKITLEYTTNLNYINFEKFNVLDYWKKFKKVIIKVSLDADPELYPYVRTGGDIRQIEENIKKVKQVMAPSELMLVGTCTTSVYNMARLPEIMDYFSRLDILAHTSLVEYPTFLSPQVLPLELKKSIEAKISSYLREIDGQRKTASADQLRKLERIKKWTTNCLRFCLGSDESQGWPQFLKFNSFWDKENKRLMDIYPEWKRFI